MLILRGDAAHLTLVEYRSQHAQSLEILADAPDFELTDTLGNPVSLSDYLGKQEVVLILLRGFA